MAAATTATTQIPQNRNNSNSNDNEVNREEIQAAIAKAVELRAMHAALMQGNNHANLRSRSHLVSQSSAQDYPVFTPGYNDQLLPGYQQIPLEDQYLSENWNDNVLGREDSDGTILSYCKNLNTSSMRRLVSLEPPICLAEDQKSVTGSSANHLTVLQASPGTDFCKSRRHSLDDFKSSYDAIKSGKDANIVMPLTDPHASLRLRSRSRGLNLSWLFHRLKKKHKNESAPDWGESEGVSHPFKDFGIIYVEALKKELIEANESRDAALMEVAEMKSSLGWLKGKLEYLENYCEELKTALRQEDQTKDSQDIEKLENLPGIGKFIDGKGENLPVSEEVMVEGFLQIVSEARLSVKQFCSTLIAQIEGTDNRLIDNLNLLLQAYKLSISCKYSKIVLHHLEAIINQSFYQDFENCVFQKDGSPKLLDPQQDCHAQFSSFVALRNLSWNEVLRKGTKYYSEEFSKFCDQKMSSIVAILNWTRLWPEQLLQAFFVAAKCIWLLHLLAFSFSPPLGILRVEENRNYDPHYMEDIFMDKQRSHGQSRVKIMVMPGFYVLDRVRRCKVLCKYKSVA